MPEAVNRYRVNGRPADDTAGILDRGLQYGDGVFRTLAVYRGEVVDLDGQLAHLGADARAIDIQAPLEALRQDCRALAEGVDVAALKIIVTRGDSQRGYAIDDRLQPNRYLYLGDPPPALGSRSEQGVAVMLCRTRLGSQPGLAGIKHLNRLPQVLARSECLAAGYAEGLLLNEQGQVVSGVQSNLFMVHDRRLLTPDIGAAAGVAGRTRARILSLAHEQGIVVQVQPCEFENLLNAEEIFVCNSLIGIWPVIELGNRRWPIGTLTRRLQAALQHPALS